MNHHSLVDQARERFNLAEDDCKKLTTYLNNTAYSLLVDWLIDNGKGGDDLATIISRLINDVNTLTDAVDDIAAIVKGLNKPKTRDNLTMTELQNERDVLDDQVSDLLNQVEEFRYEIKDLKTENASLKSKNKIFEDITKHAKRLARNRQLEIEGLKKEKDFLKGQVSALRSERDEAWSQLALLDGTEIPDDNDSEEGFNISRDGLSVAEARWEVEANYWGDNPVGESLRPPIPDESESQVPLKKIINQRLVRVIGTGRIRVGWIKTI